MPDFTINSSDYVTHHSVAYGWDVTSLIMDLESNEALSNDEFDFFKNWIEEREGEIDNAMLDAPEGAYCYIIPLSNEAQNYSDIH